MVNELTPNGSVLQGTPTNASEAEAEVFLWHGKRTRSMREPTSGGMVGVGNRK
jgi:hypothetical protein